jgi:hypothetical protein
MVAPMNIPIAVVLAGIWLILRGIGPVDDTLTLVFGIVVTVLAALVLFPLVQGRREL